MFSITLIYKVIKTIGIVLFPFIGFIGIVLSAFIAG